MYQGKDYKMGWSNGSSLFERMIDSLVVCGLINDSVSKENLKTFFIDMIENFEDFDCDTLNECKGLHPVLDECLREKEYIE